MVNGRVRLNNKKPHSLLRVMWLFLLIISVGSFESCSKDDSAAQTNLLLKTGVSYTPDGAYIPVGGQIKIGVLASGSGEPLTYIRIDRITSDDTLVQLDKGIYVGSSGYDADFTFSKDTSAYEIWRVLVMNADRDTATALLRVFRGSGSAYGDINSFGSILIGLQNNTSFDHYLDLDLGLTYDNADRSGHEQEIDIIAYYYVTSGLPSPTLICPGYSTAIGYYPDLTGWPVKNSTLFDYITSDNDLISGEQFDAAANDSLLVTAYKPDKVSGNCKYCYSGKVIPFKTQQGKYGLIKIIRADQTNSGSIEIAVKIQK